MSPDDQELSRQIKQFGSRHAAPDSLRAGLRAHMALTNAARVEPATPARESHQTTGWWRVPRIAALRHGAVGFAMGLLVMATVAPWVNRLGHRSPDEAEFVSNHVRALQAGQLTEVTSTDKHTVKPWFQGKLDYAPPVVDLAEEGFPLLGGRIEHLHDAPVATLAYARNRHMIDLYVWPSSAVSAPANASHRGYNAAHWSDGTMQYWLVSDLERRELARFGQLWRERLAAQEAGAR